jgi:hypothetical protein
VATATAARAPLTDRQAEVFAAVSDYYAFMRDGCPASYVATRLHLHHETVRDHFAALHRKGWLVGETSPATPTWLPPRRRPAR